LALSERWVSFGERLPDTRKGCGEAASGIGAQNTHQVSFLITKVLPVARRTAALLDRGDEQWVVVADAGPNGKHIMHIIGRENIEIFGRVLRQVRQRKATVDSKRLTTSFDTLEVQT
jgi:hypothetical protein